MEHHARRTFLQRIAGSSQRVELAWRDEEALILPSEIDYFPESSLNRDLYLWLAALAVAEVSDESAWFGRNQQFTLQTIKRFPGIHARYKRLVDAHLSQRGDIDKLPADEAAQEQAIRQALRDPGSVKQLPIANKAPQPVPLWLHPFPPVPHPGTPREDSDNDEQERGETLSLDDDRRRKSERTEKPESEDKGLITIRMESIFGWGEFIKLDRASDDEDDLESAADAAKDMDMISVSRDDKPSSGALRFDLDLPSADNDDLVLSDGILLPEWDYKKRELQVDYCRLLPMIAADATACDLPDHLRNTAKKLRAQFQQLAPARFWQRGQQEGSEIDLDAFLRFSGDRAAGQVAAFDGLYRDLRTGQRDLACLLLADLSLSTDTWINDHMRVIDVIRDSLFLFAESLAATGDRFSMYGFSSRKRDPIRYHQLKTFDEPYNGRIRGRINEIKPGYYTRMGAAIRHSSQLLKDQPANRRLLLILTDGKPNDLDRYEGRYGIEDTRRAIHEARQLGLQPFCVTIDTKAAEYLPYIFGNGSFVVIHKPSQLPKELPLLYASLTA
ncbi:MAG: VWA domain-containing protein, partial [Candidatus Polarisedimenticolaceae bacterium]|nr:VWA domain-containing protein [Candidatus Polarisedimenticolaceae bacterium]